jgi:hypothetical protein
VLAVARPGDILVFDRGLLSYANLCLLRQAGVHIVARLARTLSARRGTPRTRGTRPCFFEWARATCGCGGTSRRDARAAAR